MNTALRHAACVAATLLLPVCAAAHDNIVVHRKLGEWSVSSANNAFLTPYTAEVREGSYGEDVPATRSLGHFYNPQTNSAPSFALGSGPAWQNSQDQYAAAVSEYQAGNYTGEDAAFYRMGRAIHFIQDMTSPAHTHDDQHGTDNEDFEDWGPSNVNTFDFSAVPPKLVAPASAEAYVKAIARVVYDLTSYQADIDENTGPQASSEFKTMFPSLHWVDGGFFGDDVWEVDRVGSFDCFGNGVFCNDGWWMTDERLTEDNSGRGGSRRMRGYAYIENTGGNGGSPIPTIFKGVPNTTSEPLLHIYGRLLYPEAVAYGAGLLQVFAGTVGAPPTPTASFTAAAPTSTATRTNTQDPLLPTPTPTITISATRTPTQPTATPTATETPGPLCGTTPRVCHLPNSTKRSVLSMTDKPDDKSDSMKWKWSRGDVVPEEIGNPVSLTDYALCVYDEYSDTPVRIMAIPADGASLCGGVRCWSSASGGFKYADRNGTSAGLTSIVIKASPNLGRGKITMKGKGLGLPMAAPFSSTRLLSQTARVRVQLVNSLGFCWEGLFVAPADRNDAGKFKDKSE